MKAIVLFAAFCGTLAAAGNKVLIVADEFPAMEALAQKLKAGADAESAIVRQDAMPPDLSGYSTVAVYIHKTIGEPAEKAFIEYARAGGKLLLLHHSISSGKRPNRFWFPFLEIRLPLGDVAQGGYKYYDPVAMQMVNLAPNHYVTTHGVKYPDRVMYRSSDLGGGEKEYPGFTLNHTEVYLNHVFEGERTILLGVKFREEKSGTLYMQDRGGWLKKTGKGCVFYFMAGHSVREFEDPVYSQIVVNAVAYRPE